MISVIIDTKVAIARTAPISRYVLSDFHTGVVSSVTRGSWGCIIEETRNPEKMIHTAIYLGIIEASGNNRFITARGWPKIFTL